MTKDKLEEFKMELKIYPDPVLRKRALPLRRVSDKEADKMKQMLELMHHHEGVGLAGPQVGWNVRVIVMDVEGRKEKGEIFINPRILEEDGLEEDQEGCLSLPGIKAQVPRSAFLRVAAFTLEGERLEFEAEGLHARVWQHELDHLDGRLFIDRISPTAQMAIREQLQELKERRLSKQSLK